METFKRNNLVLILLGIPGNSLPDLLISFKVISCSSEFRKIMSLLMDTYPQKGALNSSGKQDKGQELV